MYQLIIPQDYKSALDLRDTQRAIKLCKDTFERRLAKVLGLERITAPLMVWADSGLNDDLNGVERKVHFDLKEMNNEAEIVQSLAKWKRMALYRYGFEAGEGLYTDMNAIRRDDSVDNLHSVFVDQWDWEKVILPEQRTEEFLEDTVRRIAHAIYLAQELVKADFPALTQNINQNVYFISSQELEDKYPGLTPEQREIEITREHKTVFIKQIGGVLKSGIRHGGRAPDYDDWTLNGDLFVWSNALDTAIEISSMGVRVDKTALEKQLKAAGSEDRLKFDYHKSIMDGTLPLTIGGGIGQSRLCMLILEKVHIGEVQASIWPEEMAAECKEKGLKLL
ncbi:MAG: aspartate--ammonia ligase [Oscillospiraceae bacterium]|nr:aspartate--ammonia ligase [Oscillospiraceae bacterium]